jgi:tetratricopeptide (TPR) repeat protein
VRPDRANIGNSQTNIANRGDTNIGGNTNVQGGTNITGPTYNTAINNSPTAGNFNRPWSGNYGGWYNGGWGGWGRYPAMWGGLAAAATLTPWAVGSAFEYSNPYYESSYESLPATTESTTVVVQQPVALDYSQPIAVPTQAEVDDTDTAVVDDSMSYFDKARASFKAGSYVLATQEAERALALLPGDRTIHEFRALCLFARRKYKEAAAALYAVLAAGPGWDWDTMAALYPSVDTYQKQLRALEQYVKANPKDAQGHFLLGYQYMVLDERESALDEYSTAAKLQPKDELSAQLADALAAKAPAKSSDDDTE